MVKRVTFNCFPTEAFIMHGISNTSIKNKIFFLICKNFMIYDIRLKNRSNQGTHTEFKSCSKCTIPQINKIKTFSMCVAMPLYLNITLLQCIILAFLSSIKVLIILYKSMNYGIQIWPCNSLSHHRTNAMTMMRWRDKAMTMVRCHDEAIVRWHDGTTAIAISIALSSVFCRAIVIVSSRHYSND